MTRTDESQVTHSLAAVRYVLFDAVGTLIRVRPSVAEVYLAVGSRHGSRLGLREIGRRFADALRDSAVGSETCEDQERVRWQSIVASVFSDVPGADGRLFSELWDAFADPAQWSLFADVPAVWSQLQARGYQLGIASNFDSRLSSICRALAPLETASHYFVSSEIAFTKPHPEFFRRIGSALQARPDEILLIGDHPIQDVQGARSAGWHAIYLDRGSKRRDGVSIGSLAEILPLFGSC
jgi:putative hydrolase of the HAD superfamily